MFRGLALLAAIVVLATWAATLPPTPIQSSLLAQNYAQEQSVPSNQIDAQTNNYQAVGTASGVVTSPSPNLNATASQPCERCQDNRADGWQTVLNDPTSVFTGIIALFTIGIFGAALREVSYTRDSSQRELRAYVFVTTKVPIITNNKTVCEFILENAGKTPAYAVKDSSAIWVDTWESPTVWKVPELSQESACIGPKDKISVTLEIEISDSDLDAIRNEKMAIWAIIELAYTDTFGKEWRTTVKSYMTGTDLQESADRRMTIKNYHAT